MEGSATASKRTKECVASSSTYFHERTWWRSWHWADFLALVQMRSGVMWREKSFSAMVLEGVCMCVAVAPTFGVQLLTEWVSDAMSLLLIVPPDELISIFGCFLFNLTFRFISAGRQVRWEEVFPYLDHLMLRPWPPSSHSSWGTIDFFLIQNNVAFRTNPVRPPAQCSTDWSQYFKFKYSKKLESYVVWRKFCLCTKQSSF